MTGESRTGLEKSRTHMSVHTKNCVLSLLSFSECLSGLLIKNANRFGSGKWKFTGSNKPFSLFLIFHIIYYLITCNALYMELLFKSAQKCLLVHNAVARTLTRVDCRKHITSVMAHLYRFPICSQAQFKWLTFKVLYSLGTVHLNLHNC